MSCKALDGDGGVDTDLLVGRAGERTDALKAGTAAAVDDWRVTSGMATEGCKKMYGEDLVLRASD